MRLIDANDVMSAVYEAEIDLYGDEYESLKNEIDKIPTITLETMRPMANWVKKNSFDELIDWTCSKCNLKIQTRKRNPLEYKYHFCPCCGAKMGLGEV